MARYDYRCSTCGEIWEESRPMLDADAPATCAAGHTGAKRLIPVFAATGRAEAGPCGGACACYPG